MKNDTTEVFCSLRELLESPKAVIDGVEYVPKEKFKDYLISKMKDEKKDCFNSDECDGIDYAISIVYNS